MNTQIGVDGTSRKRPKIPAPGLVARPRHTPAHIQSHEKNKKVNKNKWLRYFIVPGGCAAKREAQRVVLQDHDSRHARNIAMQYYLQRIRSYAVPD